jgi:hypothetical protein
MDQTIVHITDRFPLYANVCTESKNIVTFGHERHAAYAFTTRVPV